MFGSKALRRIAFTTGNAIANYAASSDPQTPVQRSAGDERAWSNIDVGNSLAGVNVNPETARQLAAYHACKNNIAQDVSKLPIKLFRALPDGTREEVRDDPRFALLHRKPNEDTTPVVFKHLLTEWKMDPGNGYAEILFNGFGIPAALRPIHPHRVHPFRDKASDRIMYRVSSSTGSSKTFPQEKILHIRGFGDDIAGHSIARIGAQSLGLSMAQQETAAALFGNGTFMGLVFEHPAQMGEEARNTFLRSLREAFSGAGRRFKPFVAEEGMILKTVEFNMRQAQMLESRQFQTVEIARWFRMPPHKIQDLSRATFSNIEEQNQEYVDDTLMPHLICWEEELNRKLLIDDPDMFFEFNVDALLRGNSAARGSFYTSQFNIGMLNRNEGRALENRNPVPGGDTYYIQGNLAAIDDDGTARLVAPGGAATAQDRIAAVHRMVTGIAERMVTREYTKANRGATDLPKTFRKKLDEFYSRQRDIMYENLLPAMECALIEAQADQGVARERTSELADILASESLERMCRAQGSGGFTNWLKDYRERRPKEIADQLIKAAGVAVMAPGSEQAPFDGEKRYSGEQVYEYSAEKDEWAEADE